MRENEATRARGRGSSASACVREKWVSMRVRARAYVCVRLCVFVCVCVCTRYHHMFSPPKNMPAVSCGQCQRMCTGAFCCPCCSKWDLDFSETCCARFPRTPVSPLLTEKTSRKDEKHPEKKKSPGEARGPGGGGRGRGAKNRGGMPSAM